MRVSLGRPDRIGAPMEFKTLHNRRIFAVLVPINDPADQRAFTAVGDWDGSQLWLRSTTSALAVPLESTGRTLVLELTPERRALLSTDTQAASSLNAVDFLACLQVALIPDGAPVLHTPFSMAWVPAWGATPRGGLTSA